MGIASSFRPEPGQSALKVDLSQNPIVYVHWRGPVSNDEMADYLAELTSFVRRPEQGRHVLIYDARGARPTATQRAMQGAWMKDNFELLAQRGLGTVFIFDNALIRGALTAVLWISRMPTDYTIVASQSEADRWAHERLADSGHR